MTTINKKEVNEKGKTALEALYALVSKYQDYDITIEGLSNTGELNITGGQANILAYELTQLGIAPNRIASAGKDGGFKDGFLVRLTPKFDAFYSFVKDQLQQQ